MPFDAAQGTGFEDGQRSGNEPGCPSSPLRVQDERMGQDPFCNCSMEKSPGSKPLPKPYICPKKST